MPLFSQDVPSINGVSDLHGFIGAILAMTLEVVPKLAREIFESDLANHGTRRPYHGQNTVTLREVRRCGEPTSQQGD